MKKIYLSMLIMGTAISTLNAQISDDVKFGIVAGVNFNNMSKNLNSKTGYHAGVKTEIDLPRLSDGVYLEIAGLITSKGAKFDGGYEVGDINATYLEVPIHLGYKYDINSNIKAIGNFGPYFGIGLFGKIKYDSYWGGEDEKNTFGCEGLMNTIDFGLGFNLGVELKEKLQFTFGYDFGVVNLNKIYHKGATTNDLKNSNFKLTMAYIFN